MTVLLLILGLVLFIGLVMLHEWGHFIVARRNGVETEEFGLGFPPRIWGKKLRKAKGDKTLYSINALPLGGFVKMKGEHDEDGGPGTFGAASLGAKAKIMLAGVGLNLAAALVLLTLVALVGMPRLITPESLGEKQFTIASDTKIIKNDVRLTYVEDDSPAAKAGLKVGDTILDILACPDTAQCAVPPRLSSADELRSITKKHAGEKIYITYLRDKIQYETSAVLRNKDEVEASKKTDNPKGFFGVVPADYTVQRSTWSAPIVSVGLSAQMTKLTFKGLGSALKGLGSTIAGGLTGNTAARRAGQAEATEQVSGPVGIFFVLKEGAKQGISFIIFIIAIISLTLAIMNVLPIPALDGGRLYLMLFYRKVLNKPLKQKTEERIVGGSFVALMFLFVLITFVDIRRFL